MCTVLEMQVLSRMSTSPSFSINNTAELMLVAQYPVMIDGMGKAGKFICLEDIWWSARGVTG